MGITAKKSFSTGQRMAKKIKPVSNSGSIEVFKQYIRKYVTHNAYRLFLGVINEKT